MAAEQRYVQGSFILPVAEWQGWLSSETHCASQIKILFSSKLLIMWPKELRDTGEVLYKYYTVVLS